MKLRALVFLIVVFMANISHAANDPAVCNALLAHGINNITKKYGAEHTIAYRYHSNCSKDFTTASDSSVNSSHLTVFGYFGLGHDSDQSSKRVQLTEWCNANREFAEANQEKFVESQVVSTPAVTAYGNCIALLRKGVSISMEAGGNHSDIVHFHVDSSHDGDLEWKGVVARGYSCTDNAPDDMKLSNANFQIDCERDQPAVVEQEGVGTITYQVGSISVNTSGPSLFNYFPEVISSYSVTPPGSIVATRNRECPPGWNELTEATDRFLVGSNGSNLGKPGGAATVTLGMEHMPAHNHANGSHNVLLQVTGNQTSQYVDSRGSKQPDLVNAKTIVSQGGGQAFRIYPPYLAVTFCERI